MIRSLPASTSFRGAAGAFAEGAVGLQLGEHGGGDVFRHEEGVAARLDAEANFGDFAQRDKPVPYRRMMSK